MLAPPPTHTHTQWNTGWLNARLYFKLNGHFWISWSFIGRPLYISVAWSSCWQGVLCFEECCSCNICMCTWTVVAGALCEATTFASFRKSLKTYLFSRTFWHPQHASHWLCNVVLKRCYAFTTLILSYDDDDGTVWSIDRPKLAFRASRVTRIVILLC